MGFGPKKGEIQLALAEYLRQDTGLDLDVRKSIRTVTGWMDDTITQGYCETCSYDEAIVRVFYVTWDGERGEHVITESFSYLIGTLDELVTNYGEDQ